MWAVEIWSLVVEMPLFVFWALRLHGLTDGKVWDEFLQNVGIHIQVHKWLCKPEDQHEYVESFTWIIRRRHTFCVYIRRCTLIQFIWYFRSLFLYSLAQNGYMYGRLYLLLCLSKVIYGPFKDEVQQYQDFKCIHLPVVRRVGGRKGRICFGRNNSSLSYR
jgi:hypothetical protein